MNEHYFSSKPSGDAAYKKIAVPIAGVVKEVTTGSGVFSLSTLDKGTTVLLGVVPEPAPTGHLLDIGSGWGPITLTLATKSPNASVWAVDTNERALELTALNAKDLGLTNVQTALPTDVPADIQFQTIWSNPPIRIGKAALHEILDTWIPRLALGGDAWLVVQKNLGSDSLQRWLEERYAPDFEVSRFTSEKSFRVLRVHRKAI